MNFLFLRFLAISISLNFCLFATKSKQFYDLDEYDQGIVITQKRILTPNMEYAFNPSIIEYGDNFLMAFCYQSGLKKTPSIALEILDQQFDLVGTVQLLDLRNAGNPFLIALNNKNYIIYENTSSNKKDVCLVEISADEDGNFECNTPMPLKHPLCTSGKMKSWTPFIYKDQLLLESNVQPHEILLTHLETGECELLHKINYQLPLSEKFAWENLQNKTSALLDEDNYLAFFCSAKNIPSTTPNKSTLHNFIGAYTFSSSPPFLVSAISSQPITGDDLYTPAASQKNAVQPGAFVQRKDRIYLLYSKNNQHIHVMVLDKDRLIKNLKPIMYNCLLPENL